MDLQIVKKIILVLAMVFSQLPFCISQNNEQDLNLKYWTMRERFRRYFVSIGKNEGQGIPAAKRQAGSLIQWNRCGGSYPTSSGAMSWGDATGYLSDYFCTLSTEYALLSQEGKDTKATLNELYYALNALDRLDAFAEPVFSNNNLAPDNNGFFLRDDVRQSTLSNWNNQYSTVNIGGPNSIGTNDERFNYKCFDSDRDINYDGKTPGNNSTNEPSLDQVITIFQGFKFIQKYVPNIYVKPTPQDVGFNLIDKMQTIASNIMEYISGADRTLLMADHQSELLYNQINPSLIFSQSLLVNNLIVHYSNCADNDVRSNWVSTNPVTHRKVGATSTATKNQDMRPFAWVIAKIGEQLTGNTYTDRDIHHEVVDQFGDGYNCLDFHDYHIPLSWIKSHVWDVLEQLPAIDDEYVVVYKGLSLQQKPICFKINDNLLTGEIGALGRNVYLLESLGAISGTWSHSNVNKFAMEYGHENMDLIYACLNDVAPQNTRLHYINLLNKLTCDGPHNYGTSDFTSFWNSGNSFEHPTYDNINTDSYTWGDYNANDWMWLYNMYRLKFGDNSFPSYEDKSCNCKTNPVIEQFYDASSTNLTSSIYLNRVFPAYLKLGISMKEFLTKNLIIDNKVLENRTELIVCNSEVTVKNNGELRNPNYFPASDSIKIIVRDGSKIFIQTDGSLNIGNNTKVILQKGGQLISNGVNSKIIVRSGGKLIIEPGALLELNNGSKLIVEDGGQVIIQTQIAAGGNSSENGVLTYNQGAEIQLKGDNAVLELNGRLHIGNNATFGITYPGSNSGYIKFNRGQGVWWDNWAPNNAHITCGTNAKINLQGKNKTDKIIEINQDNVAIPKNLAQFIMTKSQVEFNTPLARLETDRPTIITNSTFTKGSNISTYGGRGLLVFGQPTCIINNCDFNSLDYAIVGALFYSGTKLSGVKNCNFNYHGGIWTYGGGVSILNNNFESAAISSIDATLNSLISNNTIDDTYSLNGSGLALNGTNMEFDIKSNNINNLDYGVTATNANLKFRCNNLQNNSFALLGQDNVKINMSNLFGGGYNNAQNCEQFAYFQEAGLFESTDGFNNFSIVDDNPCTWIPGQTHYPFTPGYWDCPTIIAGSLINFTTFNSQTNKHEISGENNFWRPLAFSGDVIEDRQNKIRKIDISDPSFPIIDSASLFTGNILTSYGQITCPNTNGSGNGPLPHFRVHPMDNNSPSSNITTASFYNKKLQKALEFSINKMDKMQNSNKVNQAADLFTEILKYNYSTPVHSSTDKYLLELAYQKLFACVAQLTEWHRDSAITFNPIPLTLQNRFNDLHLICALRAGRKDITEIDYKEVSDLILLDKAFIYRISDNYQSALSIVNNIIASNPKAEHLNMYEKFRCSWSTEFNAINGSITTDQALKELEECQKKYSKIPDVKPKNARKKNITFNDNVVYADGYSIAVFPNPSKGALNVAYSLIEYKTLSFEIFDIQGKQIQSYSLDPQNKTFTIDNLNLENGVYFYNIKGDEKTLMVNKLVIVK